METTTLTIAAHAASPWAVAERFASDLVRGLTGEQAATRLVAHGANARGPTVRVIRDGLVRTLAARALVPGDLVRLEPGSIVPADGRLVEAHALRADESALTGQSAAAGKHVDAVPADTPLASRSSMAFAGTRIVAGRGLMLVTATQPLTKGTR
jgi:Ca2+-transporting ATPase